VAEVVRPAARRWQMTFDRQAPCPLYLFPESVLLAMVTRLPSNPRLPCSTAMVVPRQTSLLVRRSQHAFVKSGEDKALKVIGNGTPQFRSGTRG
jgi:hypothetical protein